MWKLLTSDYVSIERRLANNSLALHRLRQIKPAYPLRRLEVHVALPDLLPALGAATTLEAVYLESPPKDFVARIYEQLKGVPSLRVIDLNDVPIDAALDLLQSRTNWTHIRLPGEQKQDFKKAATLATHNKTAFTLRSLHSTEFEGLALWLTNPHLTALQIPDGTVPHSVLAELSGCPNLTHLVRSCIGCSHLVPRSRLVVRARRSSYFERCILLYVVPCSRACARTSHPSLCGLLRIDFCGP